MFCGRKMSMYGPTASAHDCCWLSRFATVVVLRRVVLLLSASSRGRELALATVLGCWLPSSSLPSPSSPPAGTWGRRSCGGCKASNSGGHTRRRGGGGVGATRPVRVHTLRAGTWNWMDEQVRSVGLGSCVCMRQSNHLSLRPIISLGARETPSAARTYPNGRGSRRMECR